MKRTVQTVLRTGSVTDCDGTLHTGFFTTWFLFLKKYITSVPSGRARAVSDGKLPYRTRRFFMATLRDGRLLAGVVGLFLGYLVSFHREAVGSSSSSSVSNQPLAQLMPPKGTSPSRLIDMSHDDVDRLPTLSHPRGDNPGGVARHSHQDRKGMLNRRTVRDESDDDDDDHGGRATAAASRNGALGDISSDVASLSVPLLCQHAWLCPMVDEKRPTVSHSAVRLPTFKEISDRHKDDKSFRHRYDAAYGLYLDPVRRLYQQRGVLLFSSSRRGSRSSQPATDSTAPPPPPPPLFSILEIGLGCDQIRIGASVALWSEYVPFARLTTFEYDEACGRKWVSEGEQRRKGPAEVASYVSNVENVYGWSFAASAAAVGPAGGFSIFYGDQAKRADLQRMLTSEDLWWTKHKGSLSTWSSVAKSAGAASSPAAAVVASSSSSSSSSAVMLYDVIIDDGGHSMVQQQTSFHVLWHRLKRGGVYIIEDINTSFKTRYGGTRRPNCTSPTTLNALVKSLLDQVHAVPVSGHPGKFLEDVEFRSPIARVDCHHFICFITKR